MAAPTWATNDVPTATDFNNWFQNIRFARRTSIATISASTTLVSDTQLTLPVDANATYNLTMVLIYDGATAADLKTQIAVPAGAAFLGDLHALIPTAASQQDFQNFPYADSTATTWGCLGGSAVGRLEGIVTTAGTSGNVTLQWAQNASNATATRLLVNSFMRIVRVE